MLDVYINVWIGPDGKPWNEDVFMSLNDAAEDIIDFEDGLGKRGHSYWTTLVRSEAQGCYEIPEEHMRRFIAQFDSRAAAGGW